MMLFQRGVAAVTLIGLIGSLTTTSAETRGSKRIPTYFTLQVLNTSGEIVEGRYFGEALRVKVEDKEKTLYWKDILSIQTGNPASATETAAIAQAIPATQSADRQVREEAVAKLVEIGVPVLDPLLKSYKDTTTAEPNAHYRLFDRIMPVGADVADRTLDIVRLANGEILRGKLTKPDDVRLTLEGGKRVTVKVADMRRVAVRREMVEREFDIDSLRHTTPIAWLDTGTGTTEKSKIEVDALGVVRLSFNEDFWIANPDGLVQPKLTGQKREIDGFRFGALLGRLGPKGERWVAGSHAEKLGMGNGRVYLAVNDNDHWQNNIGAYHVRVRVSQAYDLGDAL